MAKPHEKLAESLAALQALQAAHRRVFRSDELTRVHRERLLKNGFLQEVMKGWLISSSPGTHERDSTPWYASFWEFCAMYCGERFGEKWHLSPEQSLFLHAENTVIPTQLVVYSSKATNNAVKLLFGTSIYDLKQAEMLPSADVVVKDGLRLFAAAAALVAAPKAFFLRNPIETRILLGNIVDGTDVLRLLLNGGHSKKAGLLAAAFRRIGRAEIATEIVKTMRSAGYDVRESDPFVREQIFSVMRPATAPVVGRVHAIWEAMRQGVIDTFPKAPGLPKDKDAYLQSVDEIYKNDAYHSLSIEGYAVDPALIERVREGQWNPVLHEADRKNHDALAARGYWQAFQFVKKAVAKVIDGTNPGTLVRTAHKDWHRELFQPCVATGLIPTGALAGYRQESVYLRTSRYVPPRWETVRKAMPALLDLLEAETEPSVRAVLGHWLFGYIHPYPDGNGRIARFLMNVMLASGGFPWTVIRVDDRNKYLSALDSSSIESDIAPFSKFIADRVTWSLETKAGKESVLRKA